MQHILIYILFFSSCTYAQTDTLYMHKKYIEKDHFITYNNCFFLTQDNRQLVTQFANSQIPEEEIYRLTKNDYVIMDSVENRIVSHTWEIGDTIFYESYFESGKTYKSLQKFFSPKPYVYHSEEKLYYESGQLKMEHLQKEHVLTDYRYYYPDGSLKIEGHKYFSNPNDYFGAYYEYYPNGNIAVKKEYSLPDLSDPKYISWFKKSTLLSSTYYDIEGSITSDSSAQTNVIQGYHYPPYPKILEIYGDTLYTSDHFTEQKGYTDELSELKQRILNQIDISPYCTCKKGVAWVSLVITKDGTLSLDGVEFPDEKIREAIQKSIGSIKEWPAGIYNEKPVDTYVYTYLVLDF